MDNRNKLEQSTKPTNQSTEPTQGATQQGKVHASKSKTPTEKSVEANRRNSRKSTGPKTARGKRNSSRNGIAHGLLSNSLIFANDQEKAYFGQLHAELDREIRPRNSVESILVDEIAVTSWKLRSALNWEVASVNARRHMSRTVVNALVMNSDADCESSPLLEESADAISRMSSGWDCTEVNITMDHSTDNCKGSQQCLERSLDTFERDRPRLQKETGALERHRDGERNSKTAGNQTSVKLTSSLDTIMRYQAMLKRDWHRAVEKLRRLRSKTLKAGKNR